MKLSNTTKYLHGIIALSIIAVLIAGIYMTETETFFLYPIHKSIGIIVFAFAICRVVIRIKEGWPKPVGKNTAMQLLMAKAVHWGLITITVLYPLSGMMMSGAGGHGLNIFGLELLGSNYDAVSGKAIALNQSVAGLGHEIHGLLTWVAIAFIIAHIAGALKNHFIDKDDTIKRMFSK